MSTFKKFMMVYLTASLVASIWGYKKLEKILTKENLR